MSKHVAAGWAAWIDEWVDDARRAGGQPGTWRTRREHLQRCARSIGVTDPAAVDLDVLEAWWWSRRWAVETRRGHRTSQRLFWGWAVETGRMSESPAARLPTVRPTAPRPKPLPDEPYGRALLTASPDVRLMVRLGAEVGARRAEIAQAASWDLVPDLLGWSIILHGKGGKDRVVPLPDSLASDLRDRGPGWFFPGDDNGHLSARWVGTLIKRVLPAGWTAHSLRHRFATRLDQTGADLADIRDLLGHASIETTLRYLARPGDRLRAAVIRAAAA